MAIDLDRNFSAADQTKLDSLSAWSTSEDSHSVSGAYEIDFDVDFAIVTMTANITNLTYTNLTGNLGKPVMRIFVSNGTATFAITDTDFEATDSSEAFDNTNLTENNTVFFAKNIGSGTEKFSYSNKVLTP